MVLTAIRLFASSLSLVSFATAQLAYSQPDGKTKDFDSSLTLKQGSVAEVIWKLNSTNTGISGYVYSRLGAKPKTILNAQNEVSLWVTSTADAGNEKGYWKCLART
ncbi:hypothetical protein EJ05DRAFT_7142 [Pseudovirgaria hyperparasitica]|uniref:Uncharacterized protein n=1 Tax=Pseudovirgaria hyperparasitica TaxID=470096 RepID=A0A6A6WKA0_9PEZI|nr:uncharacterized protein EJ05DRAFT_7142 [Pseudovirgaria hyperparasitica]KAF2762594.1 hypothetical protein EJ05DRAFT_7142 [Pseudovirgaria hyperparasitica]